MVYDIQGREIGSLQTYEPQRIRVLQYNISNFTGDGTFDGYAGDDLPGYIADWAKFIGSVNADICLFEENRRWIDAGNTMLTVPTLFSKLYDYVSDWDVSDQSQSWTWPWRVTMLSNAQQKEVVKDRTSLDDAKLIKSIMTLNGVEVCVMVVHLQYGNEQEQIQKRAQQIQTLVGLTAEYDNIIVGGDFNTRSLTEMDALVQAGFTLGNGGTFGDYLTQPKPTPTNPVDNIIVKGPNLKLQGCEVLYDCELSDHYPMIANIVVA